jgi:hypothetical protein|nr:MAG TPA: hypothetical protein [Caudoviricetes sp.]
MEGPAPDADTQIAYYCFENWGWPPSKYLALPVRERILVAEFCRRSAQNQMKLKAKAGDL